ncbi:NUDIX hydrolase [Brevibacterium moorei]|uniref:NUDIX hydrolase n=1 Tax=Brevibacterium moorei TaxID=2968457 RepID=UPI00211CCB8B|nr:NUDIX hydrolase [Brevibacterium sp. 68QC2CO]MCQ9385735.1 NUDIX hydrolase [Brevibacterium sp. 68QC2CO]
MASTRQHDQAGHSGQGGTPGQAPYRDSHGKTLDEYPRPSVAVDTAVLTVAEDQLGVVVVEHDGGLRLPGTFLHQGESLADAVARALRDKACITGRAPQQLHVFDAQGRDDRGWVISVAHMVALPAEAVAGSRIIPAAEATGLDFDHDQIVARAVQQLQLDYAERPDPGHMLAEEFTMLELHRLHKAVDPGTAQKDTFRRAMSKHLEDTGRLEGGTVGKPARLFRRVEG